MKKIIRLTESELIKVIKSVIEEQVNNESVESVNWNKLQRFFSEKNFGMKKQSYDIYYSKEIPNKGGTVFFQIKWSAGMQFWIINPSQDIINRLKLKQVPNEDEGTYSDDNGVASRFYDVFSIDLEKTKGYKKIIDYLSILGMN